MNCTRILAALAAACVLVAEALGGAAAGGGKPNVLFIFADDQCFETIGARGLEDVETPNLDRLARSGISFTHAYNMGSWSGAVCVASRTMLNTGRFIWNANNVYKTSEKERAAGRFWSEYMKKAGYTTYFTGKWHVRAKAELAFDHTGSVRGGMPKQTSQGYNRPIDGQPDPWSPYDPKFGGFWAGGKHWSEVVGDESIGFLGRAKKDKKPFFMYLAFNAPHDPRQSPKAYVDKYPLSRIKVPANFLPEYPFKDAIGCGKGLRDEKLAPFPRTEHAVKVNRQEYFAIVTHMDAQIGRILKALEESGKADNTYIFFTADHGLGVGHHGLLGKQNLYDHSVRVPFMVAGPGLPGGKEIDTPIYLQDVMPTTLELAGVARPKHVEFKSLLPLLRGKASKPYDAIYGAYLAVQRSVVVGDFKLILYPKVPKARLYNLKEDPLEMKDLADDPSHRSDIRRLFARLLELQVETGDELELRKIFSQL
ncbi:MAG: sulfatase-like hydrolase/transferase [Phycisphaerae bacterium]|nr:sulfatase-like hydrolase/transferase [Phycisphaerae bacterium]